MTQIAWGRLMQLGLTRLRLRPDEFWALTPAELMLMAGLDPDGPAHMTRGGLDALLSAYPDQPENDEITS